LPGQREMVANYRCNEMKEEAVALVKEPLEQLTEQCSKKLMESFGEQCEELLNKAMSHY